MAVASLETGLKGLAPRYVALARRVGDLSDRPALVGLGWFADGFVQYAQARLNAAEVSFRTAADALWDGGDIRAWSAARARAIAIMQLQARISESLGEADHVRREGEASGDQQSAAFGLHGRVVCLAVRGGSLPEMEEALQGALRFFRQVPDPLSAAQVLADAALGAWLANEGERARRWSDESAGLLDEHGLSGPMAARSRCQRAELLAQRIIAGESVPARVLRKACRAALGASRRVPVEQPNALRALGLAEVVRGRPERARALLDRSVREAGQMESTWAQLQSRCEFALVTGDRAGLMDATAELESRGMVALARYYVGRAASRR
jgi:hypothetical protein